MRLTTQQKRYFRNDLRKARAAVHKDSENFSEIMFALERLGSYLSGTTTGLHAYSRHLSDLATFSTVPCSIEHGGEFSSLFKIVRDARNDALHVGALARHAAQNAIRISLILEDALMSDADKIIDFMITQPVTTEVWQPISLIRYEMLANSFSFLPVKSDNGWRLISDASIARFVRGISNAERKKRLALSLQNAIVKAGLELTEAIRLRPTELVKDAKDKISQKPALVFDTSDESHLIGLVTAFDLL